MRKFVIGDPPAIDLRVRRVARTLPGRAAGRVLSPLFPIGLPGGYLVIAYATAHWLHRRGRHGAGAIITSACLGWLLHRAAKVVLVRERPRRPRSRVRLDSFPSGHTTGATSLAVTTAVVLRRERLISARAAAALAFGAPLVMGAYRVFADDHWATDVAGGWVLGSAIAFASLEGVRGSSKTRRARPRVRRAAQTFAG